jgi:hypothetical protein
MKKKRININASKEILNKNKNYWNRKQKLIRTKKKILGDHKSKKETNKQR